jgi:hypothetical protein
MPELIRIGEAIRPCGGHKGTFLREEQSPRLQRWRRAPLLGDEVAGLPEVRGVPLGRLQVAGPEGGRPFRYPGFGW